MPQQVYYDSQGRPVYLGQRIGGGGEGEVYQRRDQAGQAAKIYLPEKAKKREAKVKAMFSSATERVIKIAAWPIETLYETPGGSFVGFLMKHVKDHYPVHMLYGKERRDKFPKARWSLLIHTATNLARAISVIHKDSH